MRHQAAILGIFLLTTGLLFLGVLSRGEHMEYHEHHHCKCVECYRPIKIADRTHSYRAKFPEIFADSLGAKKKFTCAKIDKTRESWTAFLNEICCDNREDCCDMYEESERID